MPAVKKAPAKAKKPRGKGKPKVLYFGHDHLDLLKRVEAKAKADKSSFAAVTIAALKKAV